MVSQVSLQDVLNALGGPLVEKSLWALLYQSCSALRKAIQDCDEVSTLLITPESMLLSYGGDIKMLPGIAGDTSDYSAPELHNSCNPPNVEKSYVFSLGMTLLAAMWNELKMVPHVSERQHKLLLSMTSKYFDQRPSLEEIFETCSYCFESQSQACDEVDKLVSYVLGSNLEHCSDSEDYQIDEADLEAEIQQVINLRGSGSKENLYPPSYGSRGSSSLSLNSGVLQRSFNANPQRSSNMYSSLPMVFTPTSHDIDGKLSARNRNGSYDPPARTSNQSHLICDGKQFNNESRFGYGSHFYTPLRQRRDGSSACTDERKQTAHLSLFRSSSDGQRQSSKCDQFSALPPNSAVDVEANLATLLKEPNRAVSSHFEYSVQYTSVISTASDSELNFPSPLPPLPPSLTDDNERTEEEFNKEPGEYLEQCSNEGQREYAESSIKDPMEQSSDNELCNEERMDYVKQSSNEKPREITNPDRFSQQEQPALKNKAIPTRATCFTEVDNGSHVGKENLDDEVSLEQEPSSTDRRKATHCSTSMKKLSSVFGPEFALINDHELLRNKKSTEKSHHLPDDRRIIEVVLLNNCIICFIVELSSTCRELFNQVIAHQSLEETHIFGLAVVQDDGEVFLESDRKLIKYAPEGWKKISTSKKKQKSKFTVFFRVKYYVENVNQLRRTETRHLYYLQLRKDIMKAKIYCHEQSAVKLAAYSLQAEKGDKKRTDDATCYFSAELHLPSHVINKLSTPVVRSILPAMHNELKGQNKEVAELNYLKEVQTLAEYGMVFYKVAREKNGPIGSTLLGLSVRGLVVYSVHKGVKTATSHWPWKKIRNLSFVNRKFIIDVEDHMVLSFYTDSYQKAQYLLHLSVNYHRFQLLPGPPIKQCRSWENENSASADLEPVQTLAEIPLPSELPLGKTFNLTSDKDEGVFGLRLAGGRNKTIGRGFIYIKSIIDGSIAAKSNSLRESDLLLEVNKQSTYGMTHKEVAALILSSSTPLTMVFHRPQDKFIGHVQVVQRDESWSDLTDTSGATVEPSLTSITEEKF